ncbi:MAG: NAD(P)H-hydrate epimerase [Phycisphaerales bacterium]|nr:MAG: NAD(P)H-hydrate epimerase [Phycisphaerales bacterium]
MPGPSSHRHESVRDDRRDEPAPAKGETFVLDRQSVRSVDRAAMGDYAVPGIVLMENASLALADEALDMLEGCAAAEPRVLIIAGSGNNGGDGWALARHLHNAGIRPIVAPLREPAADSDAGANCTICRRIGIREIPIDQLDDFRNADLIVDAIFGTGLDREVTGRAAEIIQWINDTGRPVLSVDVPSGLDCDTGKPLGVAVKASCTVTFVGLKSGFLEIDAQEHIGDVVVASIGAPIELTRRFGRPLSSLPPDEGAGMSQIPPPQRR